MLFRLLLLLLIVPVIEIWLIITIGHAIGPLATVTILLAVSLTGACLAKLQGLRAVMAIRDELSAGRLPAAHLLDGGFILAGGILLLAPGFFTDVIGFLFLIPATRNLLKKWLYKKLERSLQPGTLTIRRY